MSLVKALADATPADLADLRARAAKLREQIRPLQDELAGVERAESILAAAFADRRQARLPLVEPEEPEPKKRRHQFHVTPHPTSPKRPSLEQSRMAFYLEKAGSASAAEIAKATKVPFGVVSRILCRAAKSFARTEDGTAYRLAPGVNMDLFWK